MERESVSWSLIVKASVGNSLLFCLGSVLFTLCRGHLRLEDMTSRAWIDKVQPCQLFPIQAYIHTGEENIGTTGR